MKTTMTRLLAAAALCLTSGTAQAAVTYTLFSQDTINVSWQSASPMTKTVEITDLRGQTCFLWDGYNNVSCTSLTFIQDYFDEDGGIYTDRLFVEADTGSYAISQGLVLSRGSFSRNGDYAGTNGLKLTVAGVGSTPPVAAVPEPATWALMLAGFGLTGAAMRRRRRSVGVGVAA